MRLPLLVLLLRLPEILGALLLQDTINLTVTLLASRMGNGSVEVAEALPARHSLSVALEAGLNMIVLESDNIKLCRRL
uniref:RNase H type-1 domain-containing protein n=1 Tax=Chenopodium quinoa TaxID=63459 RepID=A0A803LM19_CHEQI